MKKRFYIPLVFICTIATVGFIFYRYAENLIYYDFDKNTINGNTYTEVSIEEYNENIDEIPYSEWYTVKIKDGILTVFNSGHTSVYRTKTDTSVFTQSDLQQLEQDGMIFTVRSELLEILHYICS